MPKGISGMAVGAAFAGGVFLWGAIKGVSISQAFHTILSGQNPTGLQPADSITGTASSGSGSGIAGNTGAANNSARKNQAIARAIASSYGWQGSQFSDLVKLWNQESGWSATALNPTSGATGIPQLNPNSHAIPAHWSNPVTQIRWGLQYIRDTYGSPSAAWQHEVAYGWY